MLFERKCKCPHDLGDCDQRGDCPCRTCHTRDRAFIRRPFKGTVAYEWQVGSIVMSLIYTPEYQRMGNPLFRRHITGLWLINLGRLVIWNDPAWNR